MQNLVCYFDGACEPRNPGGNMGIGAIICDRDTMKEIFKYSGFVKAAPENSNNVAEYMAFEILLHWIEGNAQTNSQIFIHGDSMLVIAQMLQQWKIKNGRYVQYAIRCREQLDRIKKRHDMKLHISWVRRTENGLADELSKGKLVEYGVEFKIQPTRF